MGTILLLAINLLSTPASANELGQELQAIRMVESSGGQNLNHQLLQHGLHKGTRAGGEYGIMPITARETITKAKQLTDYRGYTYLTNSQLTQELNQNKSLDSLLAFYIWNKLRKTRSAEQAACAWFRGAQSATCKDSSLLKNDDYVVKFRSALGQSQIAANSR